jgi:hypothetical protein
METRRDVVIGTCLALSGVAVSRSMAADFWKTPDGYVPPKKSQGLLKNIRFDQAKRIGDKYAQRFVRWDASPGSGKDPNSFKALLEIPNGAHRPVLYWDAKMAVDADGASPKVRKQSSGASKDTSYHFAGGTGLNAEVVPYFVVPTFDDPEKKAPGKP